MRKPESVRDEAHGIMGGARENEDRDLEAQSFGSASTAAVQQPNLVPSARLSSTCQLPNTSAVVHTTMSNASASTAVPVQAENQLPPLPPMKYTTTIQAIRWTWVTVYHRLCVLVLVPNIIVMIRLAVKHNFFKIPMPVIATAVAANTAAAILMRQELVINLLFTLAGKCPRSAPLRIRRLFAKIYHLGGVHSGAGIAATIWFTFFHATLLWNWQTDAIPGLPSNRFSFIVAITMVIDILLILIVVFAHPNLRRDNHNAFEAVHRFAGWSAVLLFWIHLIVLTNLLENSREPRRSLGDALSRSPAVYLLLLITVCLILPWLRLRRVPVRFEHLSSHASRWHFRYTNVELCSAARVTDAPLKEWHSFACIPERDGDGFSLIVSNAGDWTRRMITNPPKKIWVRGIPTRGLLHIAPIFNRLVIVATGSGIGPVISLLAARDIPCRVLWSARDPIHTYAKDIIDEVFAADPAAMVFDTDAMAKKDRPNLLRLAYALYCESNAEAVFVISNQLVTEKVVFGLESRGVPVFAPIFDS